MTTSVALPLALAAVVVAIVGLLVSRRFVPPGGWFVDGDKAAGVFGVVGSGFAVLLAFVIFIAFESYHEAGDGAATEAVAVRELFRTSGLFAEEEADVLRADLVCYARSVVELEWPAMRDGGESDVVSRWLDRFEETLLVIDVEDNRAEQALGHWLDQDTIRQEGRRGRISEADPVIAPLVWLVLIITGVLTVGFVLLFADRAERLFVQAFMVAAVALMVVFGLVLVAFLDHPYGDHSGSVTAEAMEGTVAEMEDALDVDAADRIRCDPTGTPI